ncbi:hypothetical protein L2725_06550 [Shewanella corallii]|uniref:Uncharacterized protein n=2 Tax=Shewanella TaxID=22 RepID=A0ABT0N4V5_9GAMM|nr:MULTISPECIES: hypothetical protein [Shewanella]MCL1036965.1 hypothetical protein [Shewanella submarina]MCL2913448.1 hypothetical protein [Shewanella corallii]
MNANDLSDLVLAKRTDIAETIETGAAWELWMQVEMVKILRAADKSVAREVAYPAPHDNWSLDFLAGDTQGQYAIELKVESATNAGTRLIASVASDITKLAYYPAPNPGARWVLAIGYSSAARQAMNGFADEDENHAIYHELDSIGVMVASI